MKDIDAFIEIFGDITVLQIIEIVLAFGFASMVYRKFKQYLIDRHEAEKIRDTQLKEALDAVHKYPEYRKQSIAIQDKLEDEIQMLRTSLDNYMRRLDKIEDNNNRRARNRLRDTLLQNYRYYANKERNPSQSWTRMESEAFWELFRDYEDAGGNGYMHTEVLPAMQRLTIVDVGIMTDI